jgi:hypothetical protein
MGFGLRRKLRYSGYRFLASIEPLLAKPRTRTYPPTFLIGPPRSGTTIAALVIANGFPRSYFSRIAASLCMITGKPKPEVSSRVTSLASRLFPADTQFENRYGHSSVIAAPTESEPIWHALFGTKYDAVDVASVSPSQCEAIRQVVAATENGFGNMPFFDKSTTASVRIEALRNIFSDALFIRIARDRMSVAQSIVVARRRPRFRTWIGARPRECVGMENESVERQACAQVHYTEQAIDKAIRAVGEEGCLTIRYSDLCADPNRELRRASSFFATHGVPHEYENLKIDSFTESTGKKVPDSQYEAIVTEFARIDALVPA